jgi:FKBP-type peptidyl-prolyl cis-trans isomerase FklB
VAGLRASLDGKESKLSAAQAREVITTYQSESRNKLALENQATGKAFLAKNGKKDGVITLASGLQYLVLKSGNGQQPTKNDRVKTHYHGTLIDGTVFDSSVEANEPITFAVTGVIAGWTEALQLMRVGDKWRLFVPSELAYSERGAGADIGPNTTLIFEVELLGIE